MIVDDDELSDIGLSIANDFRDKVIMKKYFNNWRERLHGRFKDKSYYDVGSRIKSYLNGNWNGHPASKSKDDLDKEAKYLQNKIDQLNYEIKRLQMSRSRLMYQRIFVFMFIFIILFLIAFLIFTFYFRFFISLQLSNEKEENSNFIDFQEHFILLFLWIFSILILSGITLRLFFSRPQSKKTMANNINQGKRKTKHKALKLHIEESDYKNTAADELLL